MGEENETQRDITFAQDSTPRKWQDHVCIIDFKQIDSQIFLQHNGFIQEQQKNYNSEHVV